MARGQTQLLRQLKDGLPEATRRALDCTVSLAGKSEVAVYLVGGGVRDLLLGLPQLDVDVMVEGDAIALASPVAAELGARLVTHPRFGTAAVRGRDFRLDLAGARQEQYARPGALPSVQPAELADDLVRRDFTINAMALRLNGPRSGEIVDSRGGRGDLERRLVRVLHSGSFQDDATRILRALRYVGRLGFRLEPDTEALLRRDLSYLDTISSARLRHELELIANEPKVAEILCWAHGLGVLPAIHPALYAGERALSAIAGLAQVPISHRGAALFCVLLARATDAEAQGAFSRLALTARQAEAANGFLALRSDEARLAQRSLRPSDAVELLASHPLAAVEAFALVAERPVAAERAREYLKRWRFVRTRLNGHDLEELGVPHGPRVGDALASLRSACLDGHATSREDEIALLREAGFVQPASAGVRYG